MLKRNIAIILFIVCSSLALGQAAKIYPKKLHWNDQLTITYDCNNKKAYLHESEDLYARIKLNFQNGDKQRVSLKLNEKQGKCTNTFRIPQNTTFININFHTLSEEDKDNNISTKIFKGNKPVRNAYIDEQDYFSKSDSLFKLEIKNYPKNYIAYGIYFSKLIPSPYSDILEKEITKYLPTLKKEYKKKINKQKESLIFSLCIAYCKTKKLDIAKTFLVKLLKLHPKSAFTKSAFATYYYDSYKAGNKPPLDKELFTELTNVFKLYPESEVCSDNISRLKRDSSLSVNLFEKSLLFALRKDSLDYRKRIELANIYYNNRMYDKAKNMTEKTILLFLKSGLSYSYCFNNSYIQRLLSESYHILAKIQKAQGDYSCSLASINSAINFIEFNQRESKYMPEYKTFRANLYMDLNLINFAQEEYTILHLQDNPKAKKELLKIYQIKQNDTTGFAEFLPRLEKFYSYKVKYKEAPLFDVTDIKGNKYSLKELRGKVVVLNFWSIGCGPCVVEMPDLNKLVDKYVNNDKVVFIAMGYDSRETINKFLNKKAFKYNIVARSSKVARKFKVSGIPAHFVINKKGKIIKQVLGAKPDIVQSLSKGIDKALVDNK